jgi:hypothetical protein
VKRIGGGLRRNRYLAKNTLGKRRDSIRLFKHGKIHQRCNAIGGRSWVASLAFLQHESRHEQLKRLSLIPPLARQLLMRGSTRSRLGHAVR